MTETPHRTGRPGRTLRRVLVGSLALNLLCVGIIAGALWTRPDGGERALGGRDGPVLLLSALAPEDRRALGARLRAQRPQGGRAGDERRPFPARIDPLIELLAAPEFDAEAFADTLREIAAESASRRAAGQAALVAQIGTMSGAERRAYAQRLEAALAARRERRRASD